MPSKSHYDDLPSYQRTRLEELARAVIRSMPRANRQSEAVRQAEERRRAVVAEQRRERQRRVEEVTGRRRCRDLSAEDRARHERSERPALPQSPHRTCDEGDLTTERLREWQQQHKTID